MMTDERDKVVMWFEAECKRRGVGVMELLDQIIADNLAPDDDAEVADQRVSPPANEEGEEVLPSIPTDIYELLDEDQRTRLFDRLGEMARARRAAWDSAGDIRAAERLDDLRDRRISVAAQRLAAHRTVGQDGWSTGCAMCDDNAPCDAYGVLWRDLREAINTMPPSDIHPLAAEYHRGFLAGLAAAQAMAPEPSSVEFDIIDGPKVAPRVIRAEDVVSRSGPPAADRSVSPQANEPCDHSSGNYRSDINGYTFCEDCGFEFGNEYHEGKLIRTVPAPRGDVPHVPPPDDALRSALVNATHYLESVRFASISHYASWERARAALGLPEVDEEKPERWGGPYVPPADTHPTGRAWLSAEDSARLDELVRLMDEAYDHALARDGHHKSSEGYIELRYETYFDRKDGWLKPPSVGVYSYVLGPSRMHDFEDISTALDTVREWHRLEMATDDEPSWDSAERDEVLSKPDRWVVEGEDYS